MSLSMTNYRFSQTHKGESPNSSYIFKFIFLTLAEWRAFVLYSYFEKDKIFSVNNLELFCVEIFCTFAVELKNNKNMKRTTEEEWKTLYRSTAAQIIAAKTANQLYSDWSWESIVFDAVVGADTFIKELKKREEKELQTSSEQ